MLGNELVRITKPWPPHPDTEALNVLHDVVNLPRLLFRHPGTIDTDKDRLQWAWLAIVTSAAHSSEIALVSLEFHYYAQCYALTRTVFEDWLVASDCERHPSTVDALLDGTRDMPKVAEMKDRLTPDLREVWEDPERGVDGRYSFLSTFVHPRSRLVESTVSPDGRIMTFPEYNKDRFDIGAQALLEANLLMLIFTGRLADHLGTSESYKWKATQLAVARGKAIGLHDKLTQDMIQRSKT